MKKSLSYCLLMFLGSVYLSGSVNADDNCVSATLNYNYPGTKPRTTGLSEAIDAWVQLRVDPSSCGNIGYIHDQGAHNIKVPKTGFTIKEGHTKDGGPASDTADLLRVEPAQIKEGMVITCGTGGCTVQ